MAVIVNLQLSLQPHERNAALAFMDRILPDTRSYDGCYWLYSATNIEDESKLEIFSMWDSKDKYDSYVQWTLDTGVALEFANYLDEEPKSSFLMSTIRPFVNYFAISSLCYFYDLPSQ